MVLSISPLPVSCKSGNHSVPVVPHQHYFSFITSISKWLYMGGLYTILLIIYIRGKVVVHESLICNSPFVFSHLRFRPCSVLPPSCPQALFSDGVCWLAFLFCLSSGYSLDLTRWNLCLTHYSVVSCAALPAGTHFDSVPSPIFCCAGAVLVY